MGINFWGVVYGTKEFLPHLLQRKEAALVNISSLFGLAGIAEQIPYCSSKFAVRGLTESLRMELIGTPVSVHTVHPGGIKTNIANNARMVEQTDKVEAIKDLEKFNENALRHTPEKAAQVIIKGIMSGEEKIMIGMETFLADVTTKLLPTSYSKVFNYLKDRTL
jgi:short-subunit dehydrogenase